ncbi:LysR substrate-binding domain-containing protein [Alicyclobacillus kakegawensis]|uniref:LysR substrate-binding domain-containing protein n=1 Tax=Alicyclobacillus kakegawensis TaxID=392012 RepID=UPI000836A9AD|nr:LysR substrate-binding domain-containing protein [Alicyclobacillus kakegawensis]
MDFHQLRYFVTAARLGHVTQAAKRLHVAQSAVSRQIHLLEEELGAPLFVREGKGVRLSPFGRRFLPQAERVLRQVEVAREEARRFHDPHAGVIRLGFPHSVGVHVVPRLLAAYRQVEPAVTFDLVQDRVRRLVDALLEGALDLAIVAPWKPLSGVPVEGRRLFEEELVAVLPADARMAQEGAATEDGAAMQDEEGMQHGAAMEDRTATEDAGAGDAARGRGLHLAALAEEPFILFKPGYTLRELVQQACMEAGFVPRVAFEAEETDTIRAFVRAGLGVSVLPPLGAGADAGVVERPVVSPPIRRTVGIVWWEQGELSAAARAFADFTVQWMGEQNGRADRP